MILSMENAIALLGGKEDDAMRLAHPDFMELNVLENVSAATMLLVIT